LLEPAERRRPPLPPRTVLVAFVVSRLVVVATAVVASAVKGGGLSAAPLLRWDFVWYSEISAHGFGVVRADGQTGWPFFPLMPALLRLGRAVGLPTGLVGLVVANLAFVAAIWGVHELARRRFGDSAATASAWAFALWPATVPLGMVYPDPIVCAASAWGFVAADDGRDARAGALALLAALARPNGLIVAVALGVHVRSVKRAVAVAAPACAGVVLWLSVQWLISGDPFMFLHAKTGWNEVNIVDALVTFSKPFQWQECLVVLVAVIAVAARVRRIPPSWTILFCLSVLPSLWFGMTGLGRYAASTFVPFVCLGALLGGRQRPWRLLWYGVSTAALAWFAWLIFSGDGWIP